MEIKRHNYALSRFHFLKAATLSLVTLSVERFSGC